MKTMNGASGKSSAHSRTKYEARWEDSISSIHQRLFGADGHLRWAHLDPVASRRSASHGLRARLQEVPDARLVVVGSGPDETHLAEKARAGGFESRVAFTGQIEPDLVAEYHRSASVLVDPVHANDVARARCPLKVMESLAAGLPVVTGDVGDRRALLGPELAAGLVRPGCPKALADGIVRP